MSLMEPRDDLEEKLFEFSKFGKLKKGGITRLTLSAEDILARKELCKRCEQLGLTISFDDMGNIYARREGTENLPAIALGSHMDSVNNGGNYDGILGVMSALSVIEALNEEKIQTRHPIVLIDFTNEEGVRYEPSLMGSGVITKKLDEIIIKKQRDEEGKMFLDVLEKSGFYGERVNRLANIGSYIELHIEQGPILENIGASIGVVKGIVGMSCYKITIDGQSSHAGTTPMKSRKDPMIEVARLVCELEEKLTQLSDTLVLTFGKLNVSPNVHTVIPKKVELYLEFRHKDEVVLSTARHIVEQVSKFSNKCDVVPKLLWKRNTVEFDPRLIKTVAESSNKLGLKTHEMYSGAGHDAQYIAEVVPTTMIFVPSVEGKSHCLDEYTSLSDCIDGRNVMLETVLKYDKEVE